MDELTSKLFMIFGLWMIFLAVLMLAPTAIKQHNIVLGVLTSLLAALLFFAVLYLEYVEVLNIVVEYADLSI